MHRYVCVISGRPSIEWHVLYARMALLLRAVREPIQHTLSGSRRANARASTSLEIMQVVLAGSLAFDLVDRVHGLYLGDAAELDWSVRMFAPIYDTPGVLLGINLACWLCLGLLIKFLLNHFAAQVLPPHTR